MHAHSLQALARASDRTRRMARVLAIALPMVWACNARPTLPPVPRASEIPGLAGEASREPRNTDVLVRLGAAYRAARRPQDALPLLERAVSLSPNDQASR